MEDCSKTSSGAASGIPDDLLVEILSRVPAKSVCRFKCVSKAWRDLIAHPDHRKKLSQPMQGLFVQTPEYEDNKFARTSFTFMDLTVRSVPLDIDPSFSFLPEMTRIKTFLDSCNGLILFSHRLEPSHVSAVDYYIVCNPTTKQWLDVPACGSRDASSQTYLAFDPAVSSHFHLVQFQFLYMYSEHVVALHVYSSETGTWSQNQIDEQKEHRQLQGWHRRFTLEVLDHPCAFVDGFLHLIVLDLDRRHILVVDIQGKARRIITVPEPYGGQRGTTTCYLFQSQGHLHCVTVEPADNNTEKLSMWVLQDYDTQEWVLKNTVNSLVVFGETGLLDYHVVDIHQDCNVLFIFHHTSSKLLAYDMDRKEVSIVGTVGDLGSEFARYIPYFSRITDSHK